MSVRNLDELGPCLQKIVSRLQSNQDLLKLLYYTGKDPLAEENLTNEQIQNEIFEKLIKVVPRVAYHEDAKSIVALRIVRGISNGENDQIRDFVIGIEVFVPMTQWIIKSSNLRPFSIMGQIQKSLSGKIIDGMGKVSGGDFQINFLTDEISCYEMTFYISNYD